jgi:hypothetical protein
VKRTVVTCVALGALMLSLSACTPYYYGSPSPDPNQGPYGHSGAYGYPPPWGYPAPSGSPGYPSH